jgi:hypothetical protein
MSKKLEFLPNAGKIGGEAAKARGERVGESKTTCPRSAR